MKKSILLISGFLIATSVLFSQVPYRMQPTKIKKDSESKLSKAESLIFNAEYEFSKTRDPKTNSLPQNIKELELRYVNKIPIKEEYYRMKKSGDNESFIQTQAWKQRGPWNCGGRFLCISLDIQNENIINAGSASGGMWHSIDGGSSWVKTTPPNAIQSVGCVVQDKRVGKNNTWYYGTGELLSTVDRRFSLLLRMLSIGNGIYKSTDNGSSWNLIKATQSNNLKSLINPFQGVWNIVVDNNNIQDVLYAACFGGIMRSTDGGNTWVQVLGDSVNMSFSSDIVMSTDGIFYAALSKMTINGAPATKSGIFRSVDGINWIDITPTGFSYTTRVIKLALAPSNENVLYVLSETPTSETNYIIFSTLEHTFWKYTDSLATGSGLWENRSVLLPKNDEQTIAYTTLGAYCMTLKVKPDDENMVFLGGTCIYRSPNGFAGSNATSQIAGYTPQYEWDINNQACHPDIHAFAFLPSDPRCLLVANDGGIHKTENCLKQVVSWTTLNNGLLGSQFYSISLDHAQNDGFLMGGLQDNNSMFTFSDDLKTSWNYIIPGDGMASCVADNKEFILGSRQYGRISSFRFDENNNAIDVMDQMPNQLVTSYFNFFTNFILDPNDNQTLYIPAQNVLWRKSDMIAASKDSSLRNTGWKKLSYSRLATGESIRALDISKIPADRIYYGSDRGNVYRLENVKTGNPMPVKLINPEFPKNGFVACIEIDPHNADNLFVVFSNYNLQSIFYSSDGGTTWSSVGGNLEENPDGSGAGPSIRCLKMLHTQGGPVYFAGTTAGVYSTVKLAGMETLWVQEATTLIGNMLVDMIEARESDGTLVVATQGGGIFSTKVVYTSVPEIKEAEYAFALEQNYPNPVKNTTTFNFSLGKNCFVDLTLYDINGKEMQKIGNGYYSMGKHKVLIDAESLSAGTYFYILKTDEGTITKKMTIEK